MRVKDGENKLVKSTVTKLEKDIIKVEGSDNPIKSNDVIFLDNDYQQYFTSIYDKDKYIEFLNKNKEKINELLEKYTVSGSIGMGGTSANMKARNEFIEYIEGETNTANAGEGNGSEKPKYSVSCTVNKKEETGMGGGRRKRHTKRRSSKRRRRTIKKRKSKRTKKTRKNRKTKRVRFKL
jgi:hypothetical protein